METLVNNINKVVKSPNKKLGGENQQLDYILAIDLSAYFHALVVGSSLLVNEDLSHPVQLKSSQVRGHWSEESVCPNRTR